MIKIYEVTAQDLPKINELENQLNLNKTKLNFFNQTLSNENFKFIKLVLGKKIIGFLQYSLNKSECDIISIGILQEFQNMGYGQLLVEYLISLNLKNLFVEVSVNNENAIMFYQKLNFSKIGLRKNYYKNQKSDAILLKFKSNVVPNGLP